MKTSRFVEFGALVAALVLPSVARADAVMGPPACPPGARGESAHAGEWCEPWTCSSDADCRGSATCRTWRVCTRASDVQPGGLRPQPAPIERMNLVVGTCEPAAQCRGDEEPPPSLVGKLVEGAPVCSEALHCVAKELPGLPAPTGEGKPTGEVKPTSGAPAPGCGCNEAPRSSGLALLVVLGLVRRRRSR